MQISLWLDSWSAIIASHAPTYLAGALLDAPLQLSPQRLQLACATHCSSCCSLLQPLLHQLRNAGLPSSHLIHCLGHGSHQRSRLLLAGLHPPGDG